MTKTYVSPGLSESRTGVNALLHQLRRVACLLNNLAASDNRFRRGEQFRHRQNVARSKTHLQASVLNRNAPSLPFSVVDLIEADGSLRMEGQLPQEAGTKTAGPVPKSWISTTKNRPTHIDHNTSAWRTMALSLVLRGLKQKPSVPPLAEYCIRTLVHLFPDPADFAEELAPLLQPHIRCSILRYTAIHEPLQNPKLYSLFEPAGHADGEIIVIGPHASLRNDFLPSHRFHNGRALGANITANMSMNRVEEQSWDEDDLEEEDANTLLHTLVLVSATFSMQSYLNFPPSLTRLALIDLSTPLPLHRLPGLCPLLLILDLSFNTWLCTSQTTLSTEDTVFGMVDWQKWTSLQVLGLRQCGVDRTISDRVNRGRWTDVTIIQ